MSDDLRYLSVDDLRALSPQELADLWELVPTERQKAYRAAYDREVRTAGAGGSDQLEMQLAEQLLQRYVESNLVPLGMRWAKAPARVREAAQRDTPLGTDTTTQPTKPRSNRVMILLGGGMLLMLLLLVLGRASSDESPTVAGTATTTLTPTPANSPTPTPLALEVQDSVIQSGDRERAVAYPVNLQVSDGANQPRVWVVQRRTVQAAEWRYDANPDIASFISGLSVQPVIGIPWSDENAAFLESLGTEAVFTVTMNTGAILRYMFAEKTAVLRSDTRYFRQVTPGLVLLLIGEVDDEGLPTGNRLLIRADYPPEQELTRHDLFIAPDGDAPTSTPFPPPDTPFAGVDVQVVAVTYNEDTLTTQMRIYNGGARPLPLVANDIWLALGYAPDPPGPRQPATALDPVTIQPKQALDLTIVWRWSGEPFASLQVGAWRFGVQIE